MMDWVFQAIDWTYLKHVTGIFVFGAFGGLAYGIGAMLECGKNSNGDWIAIKNTKVHQFVVGQMVIGIGGAMAAVFAVLTIEKAVGAPNDHPVLFVNPLYTSSMCVVAGFIGNKLLPAIGSNLQRQLNRVQDEVQKTETRVEETRAEVKTVAESARKASLDAKRAADLSFDLIKARDIAKSLGAYRKEKQKNQNVTEPFTKSEIDDYLRKLKQYADDNPTHRVLFIIWANLTDASGDWKTAVEILRTFIKNREKEDMVDGDVASAWFNEACYFAVAADFESDATRKETLNNSAVECVANCLATAKRAGPDVLATHLKSVQNDEDLQRIRDAGLLKPVLDVYVSPTTSS